MWSEAETETILSQMRAGAGVTIGGSRCHTTYFFRDGAWGYEVFDEGDTRPGGMSEAEIRALIRRDPESFRGILHEGPFRRFGAAYLAGDVEQARTELRAAAHYIDSDGRTALWEAILDWPGKAPAPEVAALLRARIEGLTAWHLFMDATGWERTPENGARGLEFADLLVAMVGPAPGIHWLRSSFHQLRGDLDAARREMRAEIEGLPASSWLRGHCETMLERLSKRAAG